jgi:hypothetical protein
MLIRDDLADAFCSSFKYLCEEDDGLPHEVADFIMEYVQEDQQMLQSEVFELQRQLAELEGERDEV